MRAALAAVDCWVSGIRREDSQTRAGAPKFGWDKRFGLWKLNPLADWTEKHVWDYINEHDIPYNPLHDQGYPSIGCTHCTRKPGAGEDARAGRWAGPRRPSAVCTAERRSLTLPRFLTRRPNHFVHLLPERPMTQTATRAAAHRPPDRRLRAARQRRLRPAHRASRAPRTGRASSRT